MRDEVVIEMTTASDASFFIYDAKGDMLRNERVYLKRGSTIFSINSLTSVLAEAMYLLQVQTAFDI